MLDVVDAQTAVNEHAKNEQLKVLVRLRPDFLAIMVWSG